MYKDFVIRLQLLLSNEKKIRHVKESTQPLSSPSISSIFVILVF